MKKNINIYDKNIQLSGLKKDIEKMEDSINRLINIRTYEKEISGIIGKSEHETVLWNIFSKPVPLTDENGFKKEIDNTLSQDNYTIKTYPFKELNNIFNKYIRIIDKRETQEEKDKKNEEYRKNIEKIEKENKEKENQIGIGTDETVTKENDEMFITICAYYDDSDMMTDYFNSHCPLSNTYAIKKVHKQPRRETLAREVIQDIEELKNLNWSWKVEEYAMGHGTYLQSQPIGTIKHNAYNGRDMVNYWYEIGFSEWTNEMKKSKWYKEEKPTNTITTQNGKAQVIENKEKQGIEIYFSNKPNDEILNILKENKFRWSKYNKCWYIKDIEENQTYIEKVKKYLE